MNIKQNSHNMNEKIFIYQVIPRLFGNDKSLNKENGTLEENGVGKFSDFNDKALKEIKKMGKQGKKRRISMPLYYKTSSY